MVLFFDLKNLFTSQDWHLLYLETTAVDANGLFYERLLKEASSILQGPCWKAKPFGLSNLGSLTMRYLSSWLLAIIFSPQPHLPSSPYCLYQCKMARHFFSGNKIQIEVEIETYMRKTTSIASISASPAFTITFQMISIFRMVQNDRN